MSNRMILEGDMMKGGRPAIALLDQVCLYLLDYLGDVKWLDLRKGTPPQRLS